MREIELLEAAKLTSPNPLCLICTNTPQGKGNLATVSWWSYLSVQPPSLGFAMMKSSFTGEMMRENKKAVLVIPGTPLTRAVMGCGSTSGRDTDKAARFGIEMRELPGCAIKIPVHSVAAIQCGLRQFVDVGDHYLYICDAEKIWANEGEQALFAWKGYAQIAPAVMQKA